MFLVDGFNLYHSLIDAQKDSGLKSAKWLNLKQLCSSYLHNAGQAVGRRAEIENVYYFSASPTHPNLSSVGNQR